LKISAKKGSTCQVYAKKGSSVAYISDGNSNGGGRIVAENGVFKNLGGAPAYRAYEYSINANSGQIKLSDCIFDSCYQVKHKTSLAKGAQLSFVIFKWQISQVNPLSERTKWEEWYIHETGSAPGSKAEIINCDFDKKIGFFHAADYVVEGNVFRRGIKCYAHWCPKWKSFKGNFIRSLTDNTEFSFPFGNKVEDCVFVKDTQSWNPHYIGVGGGSGNGGIYGSIFWFAEVQADNTKGAEGDGVMIGKAASGTREENVFTLEGNIVLPNSLGAYKKNNLSCTLVTILSKADNASVVVRKNTIFTTGIGGLNLGETNACNVGRIKNISHNLFIGNGGGYKIQNLGHTEADAVTAENVHDNASWKISLGSNHSSATGKGYHKLKFSGTTTIGKNDVDDVDPMFVDVNRNPYSWNVSIGATANMQSLMDSLSCQKGKMLEMLKYIREGLRPQNKKLSAFGASSLGSR
ncbi:MAG: hypothetical protein HRT88_10290, partial [Lentisphaeraceae bacterium]|nr:hypothetical protein [Lentisphaeraceae bacterium]